MSTEDRHLSADELLNAVEQVGEESRHLAVCQQCQTEVEGYRSMIALLRKKWHPGPLDLPAAGLVLDTAKRRHGLNGGLVSTTVGWFLLLVTASGMVCIWDSFMPQIVRTIGALQTTIGTAGMAAMLMILFGLAASPAVLLLGETRSIERSFIR